MWYNNFNSFCSSLVLLGIICGDVCFPLFSEYTVKRICSLGCLFTVARQPPVVIHDNGDVLRENPFTRHDVSRHHHHHQQQQQLQQHAVYSRRQRHKQDTRRSDNDGAVELIGIGSLSDVLLTRIFYSGLRSDDLCRCAVVCRRWNRLVWNPLLWTCIDLSQAPDCDADDALRSQFMSNSQRLLLSQVVLFSFTWCGPNVCMGTSGTPLHYVDGLSAFFYCTRFI